MVASLGLGSRMRQEQGPANLQGHSAEHRRQEREREAAKGAGGAAGLEGRSPCNSAMEGPRSCEGHGKIPSNPALLPEEKLKQEQKSMYRFSIQLFL